MKQIPNHIKNIIFDLGGVLLDLDIDKTRQAFQDLGLYDTIEKGGWSYKNNIFPDMEKGLLSDDEFRDGIRTLLPDEASDEEIDAAWCAMLIRVPERKVELLKHLRLNYNLFLFSNTNNIHLTNFRRSFSDSFGFAFDDLFSKTFYSHEIKRRKPDTKSFELVLKKAGINAPETLFIDDLEINIEGAKQVGLQTIWLQPAMRLETIFAKSSG